MLPCDIVYPRSSRLPGIYRSVLPAVAFLAMLLWSSVALGQSAYVRVNQVGYEAGTAPFRAYLMSTGSESGATFRVLNSAGATVYSSKISPLIGTWSHSKSLTYNVRSFRRKHLHSRRLGAHPRSFAAFRG